MVVKRSIPILLVLLLVLTGCNLNVNDDEAKPTLGTPILWAQSPTDTPAISGGTTPSIAPTTPAATTGASVTPPSTLATPSTPTMPSTFTPQVLPSTTPTWTYTPPVAFTATVAPTLTYPLVVSPIPTQIPTTGPIQTYAVPPTFTAAVQPSQTPVPTLYAPSAQVCATCGSLRLRGTPGTAGNVLGYLDANTQVTVIGRTEDIVWAQVRLADGGTGWVASQYLTITFDMSLVSVTGTAEDSAWPTSVPVVVPGGIDVVSGVTSHSRLIFLDGRAKGNSAHTFTRVGDSITASSYFLTQIGTSSYRLGDYTYLQGAINFFSGPNGRGANPFAAASLAARNGWSTESVLSPGLADSNVCRPGETPLECEFRLVRPSVALIMFGTNDSGGMPSGTFSANMSRIVQISIDMGVIPVLSTIPPKHYNPATDGRVAEFNQIIIATARAYDVPLWNYWQAMSQLPREGLDADGVHPSIPPSGSSVIFDSTHLQYGYTMRNLTALQVLYLLWQQVLYDGDNAVPATLPPGQTQPTSVPGGGTVTSCPGSLPPLLTVGGQGRVTPGLPNKVRAAPSMASAQVGSIPGEGVFSVISGPQCADGFMWWQVSYQGLTGWTTNGDATEYWVEPYP